MSSPWILNTALEHLLYSIWLLHKADVVWSSVTLRKEADEEPEPPCWTGTVALTSVSLQKEDEPGAGKQNSITITDSFFKFGITHICLKETLVSDHYWADSRTYFSGQLGQLCWNPALEVVKKGMEPSFEASHYTGVLHQHVLLLWKGYQTISEYKNISLYHFNMDSY